MNLKLLGLATITTLPVFALTAGAAHADDCRSAVSMIQLPNRTCVDLSYLTRLGASRRGVSISRQNLSRAIQINQQSDRSVTDTVSDDRSIVSATTRLRESPTPGLQRIKEGLLDDASTDYRQALSVNEVIEEYAFRCQHRTMKRLTGVFAHR